MRNKFLSRFTYVCLLLLLSVGGAAAQVPSAEASKLLPERLGDFRARGAARGGALRGVEPAAFGLVSAATRDYEGPRREILTVTLAQTNSDSAAYSLLTRSGSPEHPVSVGQLGTAGVVAEDYVTFFKGSVFVSLHADDRVAGDLAELRELARQLAATLPEGAGVPELAMHLPEWERAQTSVRYAVTLPALVEAIGARPALDALNFEGGAEAVMANYGQARLVVVEFTTPQYASDNDARVRQRIEQLRAEGRPVPTSYRRIGNYSAFVFDAPDEQAAAGLLDGVKYEKDVRWLDRNPHVLARAQQAYTNMTGGVILTALKITGLSILLCLGVGALVGGAVFLYRRSHTPEAVYTDAGGMVRLNIDDITHETATQPRLLEGRDG